MTHRSKSLDLTHHRPASEMFVGGASISLELGTSAAGWASQVGNQ